MVAMETELAAVSAQLEEAKEREQSLGNALATTRNALELYQRTSHQDVRRQGSLFRLCHANTFISISWITVIASWPD